MTGKREGGFDRDDRHRRRDHLVGPTIRDCVASGMPVLHPPTPNQREKEHQQIILALGIYLISSHEPAKQHRAMQRIPEPALPKAQHCRQAGSFPFAAAWEKLG